MKVNQMLVELLGVSFENSGIYDSKEYLEIEKDLEELGEKISIKVDDNLFSSYRDARIDNEILFYRYGFIEGIKFLNEIIRTPSNDLISEIDSNNSIADN